MTILRWTLTVLYLGGTVLFLYSVRQPLLADKDGMRLPVALFCGGFFLTQALFIYGGGRIRVGRPATVWRLLLPAALAAAALMLALGGLLLALDEWLYLDSRWRAASFWWLLGLSWPCWTLVLLKHAAGRDQAALLGRMLVAVLAAAAATPVYILPLWYAIKQRPSQGWLVLSGLECAIGTAAVVVAIWWAAGPALHIWHLQVRARKRGDGWPVPAAPPLDSLSPRGEGNLPPRPRRLRVALDVLAGLLFSAAPLAGLALAGRPWRAASFPVGMDAVIALAFLLGALLLRSAALWHLLRAEARPVRRLPLLLLSGLLLLLPGPLFFLLRRRREHLGPGASYNLNFRLLDLCLALPLTFAAMGGLMLYAPLTERVGGQSIQELLALLAVAPLVLAALLAGARLAERFRPEETRFRLFAQALALLEILLVVFVFSEEVVSNYNLAAWAAALVLGWAGVSLHLLLFLLRRKDAPAGGEFGGAAIDKA